METIKNLVTQKYNLFNVDLSKCPVDKNGMKMKDWINKSYDELVAEHNYNSLKWGIKLGEQENGNFIGSLDFDIYNKDKNEDCELTKNIFNNFLLSRGDNDEYGGLYTSSTKGNMNVLFDYTNCPTIKNYVDQIGTAKFTWFGLEILLKGNQVIPPTQTTCKRTKTLGKPREFDNSEKPFCIITENDNNDNYLFKYIKNLFEEKLGTSTIKTTTTKITKSKNEIVDINVYGDDDDNNQKFIQLCFDKGLFKQRACEYNDWVMMGLAIKNTFGDSEVGIKLFNNFSKLSTEKYKGFDDIKSQYSNLKNNNPKPLTMGSIKKWAKDENKNIYLEICKLISNKIFVEHDKEATEIIYKRIKQIVKYSNNTIYLKQNNIWINDFESINRFLLDVIQKSDLWKMGITGIHPYVQDYNNAKNVRILLINTIQLNEDIFFVSKLHITTRGKICFIDGVLDFVNKKFIKWENIDFEYYSCIQIPFKFGCYILSPDLDLINKIKDDILTPLFDKDIDRALHFFSRAIAGFNGDKNYGTYNGNRNCGKGILYSLFEAFYDYIKPFDLSNVLVGRNDNKTQESSRMMYWLMDYEFIRLSIAQETPKPEENMKINGRLFKKINSGGDTQTARRNYDRKDTNFVIDTTLFIAGNNELKYTENDVKEQEISFVGIKQFRTKEEIDQMRKNGIDEIVLKQFGIKDNNLKDIVKTDEYQKAFIYLIYSSFKKYAVPVKLKYDEDDENNNTPLTQRILNNYVVTNNKDDKILVSDFIIEGFNKDKIEKALNNIGIGKMKWNKRDECRNKWVYIGIRKKTNEEKDEEEDNTEIDEEDEND